MHLLLVICVFAQITCLLLTNKEVIQQEISEREVPYPFWPVGPSKSLREWGRHKEGEKEG